MAGPCLSSMCEAALLIGKHAALNHAPAAQASINWDGDLHSPNTSDSVIVIMSDLAGRVFQACAKLLCS